MIEIKSIKPLFTGIITTADKYTEDDVHESGIILNVEGSVRDYQKVLAVGSSVRDIKVGDLVVLDYSHYAKKKFSDNSLREDFVDNPTVSIEVPIVTMDGKDVFLIDQRDVKYVIEDYEEVTPEKKADSPGVNLILPKSNTIIC